MENAKIKSTETTFSSNKKWEELIESKDFIDVFLSEVLEEYIQKQRWYGGKSSQLKYI